MSRGLRVVSIAPLAALAIFAAGMARFEPDLESSWTIVPGDRIGPITRSTSEADLVDLFGEENVARAWVYLAEGFCSPGTRILAGTPDELVITWRSEERLQPATVRIRNEGARWTTRDGVRIGTTLEELEAIRGEPIVFSGFGWDYGGGTSWQAASESDGGWIGLTLAPVPGSSHPSALKSEEIYGDRQVRSDHPVVRGMTILVSVISQIWGSPWEEVECPR